MLAHQPQCRQAWPATAHLYVIATPHQSAKVVQQETLPPAWHAGELQTAPIAVGRQLTDGWYRDRGASPAAIVGTPPTAHEQCCPRSASPFHRCHCEVGMTPPPRLARMVGPEPAYWMLEAGHVDCLPPGLQSAVSPAASEVTWDVLALG